MFKNKFFRLLVIIYLIAFCVICGLLIRKIILPPMKNASPAVSVNLNISEKFNSENLVSQIYEWMELDLDRSHSIIAEGIPAMAREKDSRILDQMTEPKNWLNSFFNRVLEVDWNQPISYLSAGIPGFNNSLQVSKSPTTENGQDVHAESLRSQRIIKNENSTIYLNIPLSELIKYKHSRAQQNNQSSRVETITKPPEVEIVRRKPRVLIYHTHTSETYNDDTQPCDSKWHTLLPNKGKIVEVGAAVAKRLRELGIEVYHDTTSYDGNNFTLAYEYSKQGVSQLLQKESFDIVLDLHRDGDDDNSSLFFKDEMTVKIDGKNAAKLMILVTKGKLDYVSSKKQQELHPNWQRNLQFGLALADQMKTMYPGLLRKIDTRDNRIYNQNLHPHSLLIEVGFQKNTTAEAIYSGEKIAEVVAALFNERPTLLLD